MIRVVLTTNKKHMICLGFLLTSMFFQKNMYGYSCTALNSVRDSIRENYIKKTTAEIVRHLERENKVFPQYLHEDPMLLKVKQIEKDGTSTNFLEVIEFAKDIKKDFEHKEDELNSELKWAVRKEVFAMLGVLVGIGNFLSDAGLDDSKKRSYTKMAIGGGIAVGFGYWAYCEHKKAEDLPVHIKIITTREAQWDHEWDTELKQQKIEIF